MFIKRLCLSERNYAGLRKAEAAMMHVVDESQINLPVKPARYNVRQADGSIQKFTLFDNEIIVNTFKRVAGKYIKIK